MVDQVSILPEHLLEFLAISNLCLEKRSQKQALFLPLNIEVAGNFCFQNTKKNELNGKGGLWVARKRQTTSVEALVRSKSKRIAQSPPINRGRF